MRKVSELKCPHCGEWTLWTGHVDDRCLYCHEFVEPKRFSREVEKKIRQEVVKENDYFFIKPTDGPIKSRIKRSLNSMRWGVYYLQIIFFGFVTLILLLTSVLAL